eukprot:15421231-Alexandrium_andersonii.AAC.1
MSASLVGSEMCIRDSLEVSLRLRGSEEAEAGHRLRGSGRKGKEGSTAACLLYTSDAADDM